MTDFTKSIKSIIDDRISSPFYGTLIVSWILWNWKIPYVTFFIDSSKLAENKIEYILNKCNDINHLIYFPLLSTLIILTLIPFITNGAFWLTLIFDQWRIDKKNVIERKKLLSLEQSIQLRTEIQTQEEKFEKLLSSKNDEIKLLQLQVDSLINSQIKEPELNSANDSTKNELEEFLKNETVLQYIDKISHYAQTGYRISNIPEDVVSYYVVNDLIKSAGAGSFAMTEKGKLFIKEYLKRKK